MTRVQSESGRRGAPGQVDVAFKELEAQVKTCQLCRLGKTRTNAVPGEGNTRAAVMFVGEGPGYHEDRQGRPFVGAAGQFLDELLDIAGLDRQSVYICNVVKCRPPNNRDPLPDEMAACAPYLERQVALVNPRVIVTLGRHSMARYFAGERISQIHGTARVVEGRLCVAMYHPAAGLHQASLADVIRADFKKLPIYLEQASRLLPAAPAETQEHVREAEEIQEEVIHRVETAVVLPGDETLQEVPASTSGSASNVIDEGDAPLPAGSSAGPVAGEVAAQTTVTPEVNELAQSAPAPDGKRARRGRQAPQQSDTDDAGDGKDDSEHNRESGNEGKDYRQLSFF